MKKVNLFLVILLTSTIFACNSAENKEAENEKAEKAEKLREEVKKARGVEPCKQQR